VLKTRAERSVKVPIPVISVAVRTAAGPCRVRRIGMLLALPKKRVNMGQILEMYPYSVKGEDYHEMGNPGRPHAIGSVGHTS